MGSRSRNKPEPAAKAIEQEPIDHVYRYAIAGMARTLVADLFDQHEICPLRECRSGDSCQAYARGGFCPVKMNGEQAMLFSAMMAFHDVLRGEIDGFHPTQAAS
jgi:hypothetical protein